jgi:putative IMPACT (imprinted ancient) family translation regulator
LSRAGYSVSVDDALAARETAHRRHRDATHHIFAYRPVRPDEARFDDDGEPAGTAGRPTLRAIESAGLHRAVVVTTRYFGGTKLGTGGLARAYSAAAEAALASLDVVRVVQGVNVTLTFAYEDTGAVMRILDACGARRRSESYAEGPELEAEVAARDVERMTRLLRDSTAGRAQVHVGDGLVLIRLRS